MIKNVLVVEFLSVLIVFEPVTWWMEKRYYCWCWDY